MSDNDVTRQVLTLSDCTVYTGRSCIVNHRSFPGVEMMELCSSVTKLILIRLMGEFFLKVADTQSLFALYTL